MINLPEPGMYRTTKAYPGYEEQIPAAALVYVGVDGDGVTFVVRPGANRNNRWYYGDPTIPLRSSIWAQTLKPLPPEGFYTLPADLDVGNEGRWLKNAIVQLGFNAAGQGILFVAEQHEDEERNILVFSQQGVMADDNLMSKLIWAPILPIAKAEKTT